MWRGNGGGAGGGKWVMYLERCPGCMTAHILPMGTSIHRPHSISSKDSSNKGANPFFLPE